MEHLHVLLTEREKIAADLKSRQKAWVEKTIKGSSKQILEDKLALEEKDDWRLIRRKKTSYRIGKEKPVDEKLEDELWAIVARCGFDELGSGRNFTISVGPDVNPRQIDVFAKDRETAICIECTSSETAKKKRMDNLIEKIDSIRPKVAESINAHYGQEPRLKVRWVIATRNIDWGVADLEKAAHAKIVVLRDAEINYFTKLTQQYKCAAKYQLLAHIFQGEEIKGLQLHVPATRGQMGGKTFYNFLIKPSDLLKIAYVSHKASKDVEDLETYQRMLVPKRLKEIAAYIDDGGQFPTNIVLNIKAKDRHLRFDRKEKIGDSAFGVLYLPSQYASAWVVDGQHRLYGYAQSKRATIPTDGTTIPILAYENLPPKDEARLFVDINCEQVRVTKNLLVEIYANLKWDSPDFDERIDALCSRVVISLNQQLTSPIRDRLKMTNRQKTNQRCLTLTSFSDGLQENKFFGEIKPAGFSPGPLTDSNSKEMEKTLRKAVGLVSGYLTILANNLQDHWDLGDAKGGYLSTNNGIRVVLRVLKEVLVHIGSYHQISVDLSSVDELMPMVEEHVKPIVEHFKKASPEEIALLRSRQALKGVRQNALAIMSLVHISDPDFKPQGLIEYLSTMDEEGTKEARSLIDEISRRLFTVTASVLKREFGEANDKWWWDGIPDSVRVSCSERHEKDKGRKDKIQYMYLIDYKTIAAANWELLKDFYSMEKVGSKETQLKWLVKLNDIRTVTHHAEKWPASKDQVAFVRDIHSKVLQKIIVQ